ncbi:hypothetical protein EJ02DRAFT_422533 [Clathrospora elynae]|uniref:Uncharacterized protein n=1 Tax=Clathrospora elynae TaxID=706981 RepID=A0A6A5SMU2_9PLEO|nr:hypothetical protein EJ02DRAFT_422533 [Clathrospora elynae]
MKVSKIVKISIDEDARTHMQVEERQKPGVVMHPETLNLPTANTWLRKSWQRDKHHIRAREVERRHHPPPWFPGHTRTTHEDNTRGQREEDEDENDAKLTVTMSQALDEIAELEVEICGTGLDVGRSWFSSDLSSASTKSVGNGDAVAKTRAKAWWKPKRKHNAPRKHQDARAF